MAIKTGWLSYIPWHDDANIIRRMKEIPNVNHFAKYTIYTKKSVTGTNNAETYHLYCQDLWDVDLFHIIIFFKIYGFISNKFTALWFISMFLLFNFIVNAYLK